MMSNEISRLDAISSIQDTDLFVTAQQDKYIYSKFNSCGVHGCTLVDILINDVMQMKNLADTASVESSMFSLNQHNHDDMYNKLSFQFENASYSTYSRLSSKFQFNYVLDDKQTLSIGNLFIDGTLVPVEIPLSTSSQYMKISFDAIEPAVGTLKFVALSSISSNSQIQYKSNTFDGWMYPDGTSYQLSDFSLSNDLRKMYGSSASTTFTLPDLRHFLKMNGANEKTSNSAFGLKDGKNVLKKHAHKVEVKCNADFSFNLRMPTNPKPGDGGTFHTGNGMITVICSTINRIFSYKGRTASFSEIVQDVVPEVTVTNQTMAISSGYVGLRQYGIFTIDQAESVFAAIDKYNNSNLVYKFNRKDTMNFKAIPEMTINASMTSVNTIEIQPTASGNETYPTHVILPVMIYVGQKKRELL